MLKSSGRQREGLRNERFRNPSRIRFAVQPSLVELGSHQCDRLLLPITRFPSMCEGLLSPSTQIVHLAVGYEGCTSVTCARRIFQSSAPVKKTTLIRCTQAFARTNTESDRHSVVKFFCFRLLMGGVKSGCGSGSRRPAKRTSMTCR